MKLNDLFDSDFGENPIQTLDDQHGTLKIGDTRKPCITLGKLNNLRKLREFKRFQEMKRDSTVATMYGSGPSDDGMGGF